MRHFLTKSNLIMCTLWIISMNSVGFSPFTSVANADQRPSQLSSRVSVTTMDEIAFGYDVQISTWRNIAPSRSGNTARSVNVFQRQIYIPELDLSLTAYEGPAETILELADGQGNILTAFAETIEDGVRVTVPLEEAGTIAVVECNSSRFTAIAEQDDYSVAMTGPLGDLRHQGPVRGITELNVADQFGDQIFGLTSDKPIELDRVPAILEHAGVELAQSTQRSVLGWLIGVVKVIIDGAGAAAGAVAAGVTVGTVVTGVTIALLYLIIDCVFLGWLCENAEMDSSPARATTQRLGGYAFRDAMAMKVSYCPLRRINCVA